MNMRNAVSASRSHCEAPQTVYKLIRALSVFFILTVTLGLGGCASVSGENNYSTNNVNEPDIFELKQRAEQAYQQSHWIESVRLYQSLVERNPGDSGAWFRLGNIYTQQGAFQRAVNAYEQSLTHDADQPKAWFNLSTAYLLNAQSAMRGSYRLLKDGDPAKQLVAERLGTLSVLVNGRFEEGVAPAAQTR